MRKYYLLFILSVLFLLQTTNVFSATEITGTVVAKRGDTVKVEFQAHKDAMPKTGDMVDLSIELVPGTITPVGNGKVIEVDKNSIWVQTSNDKPDLKMKAVIHATGTPGAAPISKQDDSTNENGKDGSGNKTTPEIIDTGPQKTENKNNLNKVHPCDELAAAPYDDQRIGPSVNAEAMNPARAIVACKDAVKQYPNTPRFLFQLGRAYDVNKQYHNAFKYYQQAAELSYIVAQYQLFSLYFHGLGIPPDERAAFIWARKAAKQGYAPAQADVGYLYTNGKGIGQDYAEAVKWYRKAAEQNNSMAQFNLGRIYEKGKGVGQDYVEAVKWYRKAAEQNNHKAQTNLGWMYEKGKGIKKNMQEAIRWYKNAASQGSERAKYNLERLGND